MSDLVDAAADYLNRKLSVIALTYKLPNGLLHKHGLHDALVGPVETPEDWDILRKYFDHPKTTGIGILTNYPLIVVDIDGEEGAQQWMDLAGPADFMPDRWVAKTGRGLHLYYGYPWKQTGTIKLGPKLDLKGHGGYVAAPPSLHPDGHRYEWLLEPNDEDHPMQAPPALEAVIEEHLFDIERRITARQMNKRVRHEPFENGKFYASWGFDGLIKAMAGAAEGNRNATLYWAAFAMIEDAAGDEDWEQLRVAAKEAGLTDREIKLTMRSAQRAAAGG